MLKKPLPTWLLVLPLMLFLVIGLSRLFELRYESGDIYPPYSSLRADPLGTKALAEALDALPQVEMRRNFRPLPQLRASRPVTLVYTGVPHTAVWTEKELAVFDNMVATGSRAVFTFYPVEQPPTEKEEKRSSEQARERKKEQMDRERPAKKKSAPKKDEKSNSSKDSKDEADKAEKKKAEALKEFVDFGQVARRWGFEFGYLPTEKKEFHREASLIEAGGHLEPDLSWHSSLFFRDLKPQWKVLYMSGTMPVVIERRFGAGSIVLVADSYVVSNEALSKERHPLLLSRLFDGPSPVIFDEESRGLREESGIASLVRKYRLHGVVAGLLLLAVLFVWKNAARFIPAYPHPFSASDTVAGKEASEGFVNLLRRSIRPSAIFESCLREWRRAFVQRPRDLAIVDRLWDEERVRPARERNPIALYREIHRALVRKS